MRILDNAVLGISKISFDYKANRLDVLVFDENKKVERTIVFESVELFAYGNNYYRNMEIGEAQSMEYLHEYTIEGVEYSVRVFAAGYKVT